MNYRVVIVDDEKHQQEALTDLLKNFPEFQLQAVASSVEEAKMILNEVNPDLVFLDVQLPPFTSFDLIESFKHISFGIIFTTSYEEYAIRAFRFSAIDYLLKPVAREELATALDKFKQHKELQVQLANINNLLANRNLSPNNQKIALPTFNGFLYVEIKNVVWCEADNTYTTFFTLDNRKIIVSKPMREVELMLSNHGFFRIHNSRLINLEHVVEYTKGGTVTMADGSVIDVSRRRKDDFLHLLNR